MKKLLFLTALTLISGLACAKEDCDFVKLDKESYRSFHIEIYNFACSGIKGYDYVLHKVHVQSSHLDGIYSTYYIDNKERKQEYFETTTNEKRNGDIEYIGSKSVMLLDEFHVVVKDVEQITSYETMEKILRSKWNRLKQYIDK